MRITAMILFISLAIMSSANAAITIGLAGFGNGYHETGTNAVSFRTFGTGKGFDFNGDDIYGSHGYFFFGTNGPANAGGQPFSRYSEERPGWVTSFSAGSNFVSVAEFATYTAIDDPTVLPTSNTVDWVRSAIGLGNVGGAGDWLEVMTFAVDSSTPTNFRLGIMAGNAASADGRWDPTGLRLSVDGGAPAAVFNLPVMDTTNAGMVFFDITTDGTGGTFSVESQRRLGVGGASIAGLTFDESTPVVWPGAAIELAQDALSLQLFAPAASTSGTINASYVTGLTSNDVQIVSLVAGSGFGASVSNGTLGLSNLNETITITYSNAGALGHQDVTNATLVVSWTEVGSGVTNTANVALDVIYFDPPSRLAIAPNALSLRLSDPDISTNGTITASYIVGATTSNDVLILSLVAGSGFSATVSNNNLSTTNPNEAITITYTNTGNLVNHDDATNATLMINWTEIGSGVTNTTNVALAVTYYVEAPITIALPGSGNGYHETGTNVVGFRTFGISKNFDFNGDDIYGSHGYFFFGTNGPVNVSGQPFARNAPNPPSWVTNFSAGAGFSSVAEFATYTAIDDPTVNPSFDTPDWIRSGVGVGISGGVGEWQELITFEVDGTAPTNFRIGLMAGNEATADGRWDPTGLRLSVDGRDPIAVTNLQVMNGTNAGMVFFDLTTSGTGATISVESQRRAGVGGATIAGVTFDEASPVVWPGAALELAPNALSLELYAPNTSVSGTVTASYLFLTSSNDIDIVLVTADAGFSASMTNTTLGLSNLTETITVAYTNTGALGHLEATNATLSVSWTESGSGVTNTTDVALDVIYFDPPSRLGLSSNALSLILTAPSMTTSGTVDALYLVGTTTSNDVQIVSLVVGSGFGASVSNSFLGTTNLNEAITVTYTNTGALVDDGDATNSTLTISWTELGSGVTNTTNVALDVTYYVPPPVTFALVGSGNGYDETGTNVIGFRTFGIAKNFDFNGDDIYGSHGYFFFGTNGPVNTNGLPFTQNTQNAPSWVTNFSQGAHFNQVAENAAYTEMDDPTLDPTFGTANWARPGMGAGLGGFAGGWQEILTFAIDGTAPTNFRVGIMAGNNHFLSGTHDPIGLRLSVNGGTPVTVNNLPILDDTTAGMVFFDVTTFGTNATISVQGHRRPGQANSASIAGITFDEASPVVWSNVSSKLSLVPDPLSLQLEPPAPSVTGTIAAAYVFGTNPTSTVQILSLSADAGFSLPASVSNSILSPSNLTESITIVYTNTGALVAHGDSTNASLVVNWTEVGSGVTNTTTSTVAVTYYNPTGSTVLAGYDFDDGSGNPTRVVTAKDPNVTASDYNVGSGLNNVINVANGNSNFSNQDAEGNPFGTDNGLEFGGARAAFGFTDMNNGDNLNLAITNNDYMTFTITPDAGYEMDLTKFTFRPFVKELANSAERWALFSSVDGFTNGAQIAVGQTTTILTYVNSEVDLTDARFQGLTNITFRLYIYGGNASANSATLFDKVIVKGVVASRQADLRLTKTVNTTNMLFESNLVYTIAVTNVGTTAVSSVSVTDSLPAMVSFLFSVPPPNVTNGNEYGYLIGTLGGGSNVTIDITVAVTSGVPGSILTNWATVTTTNLESSLANNTDSAMTLLPDSDGDGLINPLDPDDDNDDFPDCAETIANTDPLDPNSYLWVRIDRTGTQTIQDLTFPTSTGRTYWIEGSTNLYVGPWTNVRTNIPGTGGMLMIPNTNGIDRMYYRVGVESP